MSRGGTPVSFTTSGTFNGDPVTLVNNTAGANTGPAAVVGMADYHTLRVTLTVAFVGGTSPTITPALETSSGDGTWNALTPSVSQGGTLAGLAGGATRRLTYTGLDRFVRVNWTTTGAPTSTTISLIGEAV